jgi:Protein of unknown function (DUF3300)
MTTKRLNAELRVFVAIVCAFALTPGDTLAYASFCQRAPAPSQTNQGSKVSADQLDSLVAPIALYPDPLLAQTLAAATYRSKSSSSSSGSRRTRILRTRPWQMPWQNNRGIQACRR